MKLIGVGIEEISTPGPSPMGEGKNHHLVTAYYCSLLRMGNLFKIFVCFL
jgi:hypothetical protein